MTLTNFLFSPYVVLSVLILFLIHYLYKQFFSLNYWERRGVYTVRPALPFLGNFYDLFLGRSVVDMINSLHEKAGDRPFAGVYAFTTPLLILKDPELIKRVLIKDFQYFVDRGFHSNPDTDPVARNLIHMYSKDWKAFRPRLAGVYSAGKVKNTVESILKICDDVLAKLEEEEVNQQKDGGVGATTFVAEVSDLMTRYATDCYTTNSLGFNERSVANGMKSEFYRHGSMALGWWFIRHVFVGSFYPRIHRLLGMRVANPGVTRYFQQLADRLMRSWREHTSDETANKNGSVETPELLQTLMEMRDEKDPPSQNGNGNGNSVAPVDDWFVAAQVYVFFIAASDSVGNTVAAALYELAQQPRAQARVRYEVREAFRGPFEVNMYTLNNDLKYTGQVLSEAMRKYPVLSLVFRQCTQEYRIPDTDVVLEKGTLVFVPVHSLHRDPKLYPYPEDFYPDRFSEENVRDRSEGAYLPFGRGPRMCPGTIVAMTQMKLMLAKILLQYEVSLNLKTSCPLSFEPSRFLLTPRGGVWLNFRRISDDET